MKYWTNVNSKNDNFSCLSNIYFNSSQLCQSQDLSISKSLTCFLGDIFKADVIVIATSRLCSSFHSTLHDHQSVCDFFPTVCLITLITPSTLAVPWNMDRIDQINIIDYHTFLKSADLFYPYSM